MAVTLKDFILLVVLLAVLLCLCDSAPASDRKKNRRKLKNRARDPQLSNQAIKKGIAKDITLTSDESLQFSKRTNYARKLNKTTYVFDCSVNDYDPVSGDVIWNKDDFELEQYRRDH
eukprot:TCONS_00034304-protein